MRDALFPAEAETDPRLRPDHRRPARRDRAPGARAGPTTCGPRGPASAPSALARAGSNFEITTHRAEVYVPDSRKPEVTFGDDIELDLSRRDFTINALALRLPDMELIDPFDGLGDLAAGRLRTPLDPEISFGDDPLRMLRAARFAARFNLKPDPASRPPSRRCTIGCPSCRANASATSWTRWSWSTCPSEALWFVVRTGLATDFLPELPGSGPRTGPHPPSQGRAGPHAGRDGQDVEGPHPPAGRPLPRCGQAEDAGHHRRRRDLPPSRDGGRAHDPGPHDGPALLGRGHRHGGAVGRAPSAVPHLPAGLDRQGGAPLCPRCRGRCSTGSTS